MNNNAPQQATGASETTRFFCTRISSAAGVVQHLLANRLAIPCCVSMLCLRICGKCREMRRRSFASEGRFGEAEPEGCASIRAFGRDACAAFALPSPRSTIIRLPSVASSSRLQHHHRAIRLVSRHFPRLHVAFRSASIPLVALLSHPL